VLAEGLCEEFRRQGLCVPILRPKSFIGPERLGVFSMLYEWARDGKSFPILGRGDNPYQFLDVEDLCEAIWLCATLPDEVVNDTFTSERRNLAPCVPTSRPFWTPPGTADVSSLCGEAGDSGTAGAETTGPFTAVPVDIRDGGQGIFRIHSQGGRAAGLRAQVLQPRRTRAQLPMVPGERRPAAGHYRSDPSRALGTGSLAAGQGVLLGGWASMPCGHRGAAGLLWSAEEQADEA